MNKWTIILLIVIIGLFFYNNSKKQAGYRTINPTDAQAMLSQNEEVILLDVRSKEEYQEKHIEGSLLIPLNVLAEQVEIKLPNKNQKIIVYCRSGNRSKTAANTLLSMGYKNVYDLGGINSWPFDTN
ncbi:rhodanese-like domain-containing protein [Alkaliphilus peptidifermentans]|uniref:Rhodanese-related sulfurtransferase n=1 Tax=Alkaliphilus peptidifermentans DSM 18978 TaxID=1120976 RepID=A0A1G5GLG2_9FIRM|nr:rhodanese-like domain-containing protein [Alkaliphilus peptidifermentans]SCY52375.1 Rhodanese-related sulfurtransferase [Alkaliphilus peptidifermentans DSM 18978]